MSELSEEIEDILSMLVENRLTPEELIDYLAIEKGDYSPKEWAGKRRVNNSELICTNHSNAHRKIDDPVMDIATVIVDRQDILDALKFNRDRLGVNNRTSACLRICPPFKMEVRAEIFYEEKGNRYPSELFIEPRHIYAGEFFGETSVPHPVEDFEGDLNRLNEMLRDEIEIPGTSGIWTVSIQYE